MPVTLTHKCTHRSSHAHSHARAQLREQTGRTHSACLGAQCSCTCVRAFTHTDAAYAQCVHRRGAAGQLYHLSPIHHDHASARSQAQCVHTRAGQLSPSHHNHASAHSQAQRAQARRGRAAAPFEPQRYVLLLLVHNARDDGRAGGVLIGAQLVYETRPCVHACTRTRAHSTSPQSTAECGRASMPPHAHSTSPQITGRRGHALTATGSERREQLASRGRGRTQRRPAIVAHEHQQRASMQ